MRSTGLFSFAPTEPVASASLRTEPGASSLSVTHPGFCVTYRAFRVLSAGVRLPNPLCGRDGRQVGRWRVGDRTGNPAAGNASLVPAAKQIPRSKVGERMATHDTCEHAADQPGRHGCAGGVRPLGRGGLTWSGPYALGMTPGEISALGQVDRILGPRSLSALPSPETDAFGRSPRPLVRWVRSVPDSKERIPWSIASWVRRGSTCQKSA